MVAMSNIIVAEEEPVAKEVIFESSIGTRSFCWPSTVLVWASEGLNAAAVVAEIQRSGFYPDCEPIFSERPPDTNCGFVYVTMRPRSGNHLPD